MENKISGVYKITNNVTGDFYIGSSKNVEHRWLMHRCNSTWKNHPNSRLYQDMAKYGRDNFTFEVIEKASNLREREQYFIDLLKPSYNDKRARGPNIKRQVENHRKSTKGWIEAHRAEYSASRKDNYSRLCSYKSEILTLNALTSRFRNQKIDHAWLEAKKYLL